MAKTVAESALVKTAVFGADPNWGRIVSAAGYAGVEFEEEQLSLWLGDLLLYHAGTPQPFDAAAASAYLKRERDGPLASALHARLWPLHLLDLRPDARVHPAECGLYDVSTLVSRDAQRKLCPCATLRCAYAADQGGRVGLPFPSLGHALEWQAL